jgi:hypothetical protein
LALFGVVGAAMMRALDRQARFHDGVTRLLESRSQLAVTHEALALELRSLASSDGDVISVSDTSLVYRERVGGGVVCALASSTIDLPPAALASGASLTVFATSPQPGDTAWLFDEGSSPAAADDRWVAALVASAVTLRGVCAGSPFVDPVLDAGTPGWRLTLMSASTLPPTILPGAVVRLTRHARFALYRATTGDTNLGWSEWNAPAAAWNVIQPLSGPFLAVNRSTPSASGVVFTTFDSIGSGTVVGVSATPVARVNVFVRSVTRGVVRVEGMTRGARVDSLGSVIALRNRR